MSSIAPTINVCSYNGHDDLCHLSLYNLRAARILPVVVLPIGLKSRRVHIRTWMNSKHASRTASTRRFRTRFSNTSLFCMDRDPSMTNTTCFRIFKKELAWFITTTPLSHSILFAQFFVVTLLIFVQICGLRLYVDNYSYAYIVPHEYADRWDIRNMLGKFAAVCCTTHVLLLSVLQWVFV